MSALDNSLTTLARAKSFMEVSGSSKDLILTMLIASVSKFIEETYLGRSLKRTVVSNELINGRGANKIWVKQGPIIDGETVTLQHRTTSSNTDDWETIDSNNYFIDYLNGSISLVRDNTSWQGASAHFMEGVQNYRVSYTGGYYMPKDSQYQDGVDDYLDLPFDLELAVLDLISAAYNLRTSGGIKSKSVGDASLSYASEMEKHPTIKATLDRYRVYNYR